MKIILGFLSSIIFLHCGTYTDQRQKTKKYNYEYVDNEDAILDEENEYADDEISTEESNYQDDEKEIVDQDPIPTPTSSSTPLNPTPTPIVSILPVESNKPNWKVVLMASDQGDEWSWIDAFDNARLKLKEIFMDKNVKTENIRELSLHDEFVNTQVKKTSSANLEKSLESLNINQTNDQCIVHMTSHGSSDGFNLGWNRLSPSTLDSILTKTCQDQPTVVLISACFSGLYVKQNSVVKKPNRIILTAARYDRTSFGCSPEDEYTYWDNCLIDSLQDPSLKKWSELATEIRSCIIGKEGGSTSSDPQSYIGEEVKNLELPE